MRHKISGRRLGRSSSQRKALRRGLITELYRHERIKTTEAKAKAIRAEAEKIITLAKRGNAAGESAMVNARRRAAAKLSDPEIVKKLFDDLAIRYEERPGGYTRILKLGPRMSDSAEMVLMELVEE
jgi:large subunit ribosomal protein L17